MFMSVLIVRLKVLAHPEQGNASKRHEYASEIRSWKYGSGEYATVQEHQTNHHFLHHDAVKLHQYFIMSVGELKGTALSTSKEPVVTWYTCEHHFDWPEHQDSPFHLRTFPRRSEELIIVFLVLRKFVPGVMVSFTSIGFKNRQIVRLANLLWVLLTRRGTLLIYIAHS